MNLSTKKRKVDLTQKFNNCLGRLFALETHTKLEYRRLIGKHRNGILFYLLFIHYRLNLRTYLVTATMVTKVKGGNGSKWWWPVELDWR